MCKLLGVSSSGFYAWSQRKPSKREQRDAMLLAKIRQVHEGSHGIYGVPRIHAELRAERFKVGRRRVARLMKQAKLCGVSRRKRIFTTVRDAGSKISSDLVERDFTATRRDRLWVADATYIPIVGGGFSYLAMVLDVFSRRVVGWKMGTELKTELMLEALEMAHAQRRPERVVHHSDHGCQYTSYAFGKRCQALGVTLSMGSIGDAYDNAMAESFFASLECELLARKRFYSHAEASMAVFEYIEGFYNTRRRHSSLGYLSPADFERRNAA